MATNSRNNLVKDIDVETIEEDNDSIEKTSGSSSAGLKFFVFIIFLLVLASSGGVYYLYQQSISSNDQLNKKISTIKPVQSKLLMLEDSVKSHSEVITAHENSIIQLQDEQKQINSQLSARMDENNSSPASDSDNLLNKLIQQQKEVNLSLKQQMENRISAEVIKLQSMIAGKLNANEDLSADSSVEAVQETAAIIHRTDETMAQETDTVQEIADLDPKATETVQETADIIENTITSSDNTDEAQQTVKQTSETQTIKVHQLIIPDQQLIYMSQAYALASKIQDNLIYDEQKQHHLLALDKLKLLLQKTKKQKLLTAVDEISSQIQSGNDNDRERLIHEIKLLAQSIRQLQVQSEKIKRLTSDPELTATEQEKTKLELAKEKFVSEIKSLVVFRHKQEKSSYLMSPQQSDLIKQSMILKLEKSELALMQKNYSLYLAQLNALLEQVDVFFDSKDALVEEFKMRINDLLNKNYQTKSEHWFTLMKSLLEEIEKDMMLYQGAQLTEEQ